MQQHAPAVGMSDRDVIKTLKEQTWILADHRDQAWKRVEQIMRQSRDIRAARHAAEMILNRTDPLPRGPEPDDTAHRPVSVSITIVAGAEPRAALPAGGWALRVDGDRPVNGGGDRGVRDAG